MKALEWKVVSRVNAGKHIVWANGAERPASECEVAMWQRIEQLEKVLADLRATITTTLAAASATPPPLPTSPTLTDAWRSAPQFGQRSASPPNGATAASTPPPAAPTNTIPSASRRAYLKEKFRERQQNASRSTHDHFLDDDETAEPHDTLAGPRNELPG